MFFFLRSVLLGVLINCTITNIQLKFVFACEKVCLPSRPRSKGDIDVYKFVLCPTLQSFMQLVAAVSEELLIPKLDVQTDRQTNRGQNHIVSLPRWGRHNNCKEKNQYIVNPLTIIGW